MATAVVAVVLSAAPAVAATGQRHEPRHRAAARASVEITSVTPDFAQPKDTITVSGVVTNPTTAALTGLSVQLWSSSIPLVNRDAMASYIGSPDFTTADTAEGLPTAVFSLAAHAKMQWTLTLRPSQVGMHLFGVYPLAAQLSGPLGALARDRTFLPFWPGTSQTHALKPLSVAWIWPLIDTPQQAACRAIRNGQLATSLAPGGRLNGLLADGSTTTAAQAKLTWAIDPALLRDAALMTNAYRVGVSPTCTGGTVKPADPAARTWLSEVREVGDSQNFFATPYADVDVAALAHHGLDGNLASAFSSGRQAAASTVFTTGKPGAARGTILGRPQHTTPSLAGQLAWPAGGIADYGVLEDLVHNDIGTVILDSTMMPPSPPVTYTPGAVASTSAVGRRLHVVLADHTLARILATPQDEIPGAMPAPAEAGGAAPAVPSTLSEAAAFAKEQWFLAETAMIAYELPGTARSVVIMPPRRWNPPAGMAGTLLSRTVHAPWLRPATLASLITGPKAPGSMPPRQQPPPRRASPSELRGPLLHELSLLTGQIHLLSSILVTAGHGYLSTAIAAVESSAWRGDKTSQRRAEQQYRRVSSYAHAQLQQVTIVHSLHVTLGGKSGPVPVSVNNQLDREIQVRLEVSPATADRLVIGPFHAVVKVPAKAQRLIKIPVRSAAAGSTSLTLELATPDGRPLLGSRTTLTVEATHFGTLAIVIIVVALLVFVSTATGRAIRRGAEPPDGGAPDDADHGDVPDSGDYGDVPGGADYGDGDTAGEHAPAESTSEPGERGEEGQRFPAVADPASGGEEADSVVAGDPEQAKEADDHASTPDRAPHL
jgi:hypothetical protein